MVEVTDEQVRRYMNLFRGYPNRFGRFVITGQDEATGKQQGEARTEKRPPSIDDYREHLEGKVRMGVVPLKEDNKVNFSALDIDKYDISHEDYARKTADLPLIITRSKSGGIHAWMFTASKPIEASNAIKVLKHWAAELGHSKCEVFPKQAGRAGPEDVGNWINLPYFGDTCKAVVWDREAKQAVSFDLDQFLTVAENVVINPEYIADGAFKVVARDKKSSQYDFADGPPCLVAALTKWASGDLDKSGFRNRLFFNIAIYLKRKYDSHKVRSLVLSINAGTYTLVIPEKGGGIKECLIPAFGLTEGELEQTVLKSVLNQGKDFGYTCAEYPLSEFCQRTVCLKRTYGVGGGSTKDVEMSLENVVQYKSNPPRYFLDADGVRVVFPSSEVYKTQKLFAARILDTTGKHFAAMPPKDFDNLHEFLASKMQIIVPEFEGSEILDALKDFIDEYKAREATEVLKDRVFHNDKESRYEFLPQAFKNYLKLKKINFDKNALAKELEEDIGLQSGDQGSKRIGKKVIRAWFVPFDAFDKLTREDRQIESEEPF